MIPGTSSLSSESVESDQKSSFSNLTNKQPVEVRYTTKFDNVSQEERDAAHNLVHLHMQSSICPKGNNIHQNESIQGRTNYSTTYSSDGREYGILTNNQQNVPDSHTRMVPRMISNYPPLHASYHLQNLFHQYDVQKEIIQTKHYEHSYHTNQAVQEFVNVSGNSPKYFKFAHC